MRKLLFTLTAAATAVSLLAGPGNAWGRNALLVPVEVAAACAAHVGVGQPMVLDYQLVDGYFRLVQVRPGLGVTEAQSNVINACIANYAGYDVEKVNPIFGKERYVVRFNRCRSGVLVGGDSYCVKEPG